MLVSKWQPAPYDLFAQIRHIWRLAAYFDRDPLSTQLILWDSSGRPGICFQRSQRALIVGLGVTQPSYQWRPEPAEASRRTHENKPVRMRTVLHPMSDNQPARRLSLRVTAKADLAPRAPLDEAFLKAFDAMVEHLNLAWAKTANCRVQNTPDLGQSAVFKA